MRGYRNERFTGNHSVLLSGDVRYSFDKFKTGLLPVQFGIYGGCDYGRVWLYDEKSNTWHNSLGGGVGSMQ